MKKIGKKEERKRERSESESGRKGKAEREGVDAEWGLGDGGKVGDEGRAGYGTVGGQVGGGVSGEIRRLREGK